MYKVDKTIEEAIIQQYYDHQNLYRSLKHDITDIIENIISKNNIKISNFAIRIKSEEALRRKICLKHKYKDISDITDIVACRIITLFESDIDVIYDLIKQNFDIVEYNDKRKKRKKIKSNGIVCDNNVSIVFEYSNISSDKNRRKKKRAG